MDAFYVDFPVSGVHTPVFMPPLVAFAVSFIASMGGVSGAFFLLPYQVSMLHFVSPSVTSTNFLYNVVAIPSGVWRYIREGRMAWPLAGIIISGTLPGVFLGYYLRVLYLPDPGTFRLFVGCILLYVAFHLLYATFGPAGRTGGLRSPAPQLGAASGKAMSGRNSRRAPDGATVRTLSMSMRRIEYAFGGETFSFGPIGLFLVSCIVGIIGGAYGIGGGSILAPFCVAVYRLPVYTIAGAALLGTFLTSIAGVLFYSIIPSQSGVPTSPDWLLGILFGFGGMLGMYCGARLQKRVPQEWIKVILSLIMLYISSRYIYGFFSR